jgi:hypothetical protein
MFTSATPRDAGKPARGADHGIRWQRNVPKSQKLRLRKLMRYFWQRSPILWRPFSRLLGANGSNSHFASALLWYSAIPPPIRIIVRNE